MKKNYNRDVMSDMPVDASFMPSDVIKTADAKARSKIKVIGTKQREGKKDLQNRDDDYEEKHNSRGRFMQASKELEELERINVENLKTYRFKARRNRVVIIVLSILLILEIVGVSAFLTFNKLTSNCFMVVHSDVKAVCIVDDAAISEFRCPADLKGNRIYELNIELELQEEGLYLISYTPKCYQKRVLMENTLVYEHNTSLFRQSGGGMYKSVQPIDGNQTITLCGGVVLDYQYERSLNANNFKMEFHIYIEKV